MSNKVEDFLSTIEEQEVVEAIRLAEKNTSGEIRVHIENTFKGDIENRALEVFSILKMHNTRLQNGVLIYVAVQNKAFAIYGDKGIHDLVGADFWNHTKTTIANHFKSGNFKQGLVDGILHAGEQLKKHFPIANLDSNELSNEISKG
ncbi:TPM domain-containing protein [Oceanihabitans sp. 2_MG-2023]|uniref:TPM domain-containing protein n=1 Tax=Oceanihabitans sp. 2_MG-2023 TaxID=3062661 RepID=UPI0026E16F17|nr:TPM domain-containing protein [Oceanihabitans sp. 2_MG-2023]MDO6596116.1 TPM domain-containing protein [Oceanihabitans sp. 2_MG-2023]